MGNERIGGPDPELEARLRAIRYANAIDRDDAVAERLEIEAILARGLAGEIDQVAINSGLGAAIGGQVLLGSVYRGIIEEHPPVTK